MSTVPVGVGVCFNQRRQTVEGFGASDVWGVERVGSKAGSCRERVAELLFSRQFGSDGRPKGAGLTSWRFSLGAGSKDLDEGPKWTQSDCFLQPEWHSAGGIRDTRSYDFRRCPGQRWMLAAAQRHGVEHFVISVRAPPAPLVRSVSDGGVLDSNSAPTGPDGIPLPGPKPRGTSRPIPTDQAPPPCSLRGTVSLHVDEFCFYMAHVLEHFNSQEGIHFSAIAPLHSPSSPSIGECCTWRVDEIATLVHALGNALESRNLTTTEINVCEASALDILIQSVPSLEQYSDFIAAFFGGGGIGASPPPLRLRTLTGSSSLSCYTEGDRLLSMRERLAAVLAPLRSLGIRYWQNEYVPRFSAHDRRIPAEALEAAFAVHGPLGDPCGMGAALHTARVLHADLCIAEASMWNWGPAVGGFGHDDGLLRVGEGERAVEEKRVLWAIAHWSLFVRPGMIRVGIERDDGLTDRDEVLHGLLVSAFTEPTASSRFVVVAVNLGFLPRKIRLRGLAPPGESCVVDKASSFTSFLTDETSALRPMEVHSINAPFRIPPRSLVSFVGDFIREGTAYRILSASSNLDLCVSVHSPASGEAAVVVMDPPSEGAWEQLWVVVHVGDADVLLLCIASGMPLSVAHGSAVPAAPLVQGGSSLMANTWEVKRTLSGHSILIAAHSGYALEAHGDSIRCCPRTGDNDQKWELRAAPEAMAPQLAAAAMSQALRARDIDRVKTLPPPQTPAAPPPKPTPTLTLPPHPPRASASDFRPSPLLHLASNQPPGPPGSHALLPGGSTDVLPPGLPAAVRTPALPTEPLEEHPWNAPAPVHVRPVRGHGAANKLPSRKIWGGEWNPSDNTTPLNATAGRRVQASGPGVHASFTSSPGVHASFTSSPGVHASFTTPTPFGVSGIPTVIVSGAAPAAPPPMPDVGVSGSFLEFPSNSKTQPVASNLPSPAGEPVTPAPDSTPEALSGSAKEDPKHGSGSLEGSFSAHDRFRFSGSVGPQSQLQAAADINTIERLNRQRLKQKQDEALRKQSEEEKRQQDEKDQARQAEESERLSMVRSMEIKDERQRESKMGTSHLVVTLKMARSEFDDFQKHFRTSIAKALSIQPSNVLLTPFVGAEDLAASKLKVEIRFHGLVPRIASEKLDQLARLMAAPEKETKVGGEGTGGMIDSSGSSDDTLTKQDRREPVGGRRTQSRGLARSRAKK
eukprot:Hpha_TRINITY_DN16647_c1_g9::TRINITY_DN16647_c1_g9_i1::g.181424::m.181424